MVSNLLKGTHKDIIATNIKTLKHSGMNEKQATHLALKHSKKHKLIAPFYK